MKSIKPSLEILAAGVAWGCTGFFSRTLFHAGISAFNTVVIRNFGALLVLLVIFALFDRNVFRIQLRHLPIFFGSGTISVMMFALCYFKCQEHCSLAVSAILLYTSPAMVVIMSALVFHEKITSRKLLALVLALLGCSLVTGIWNGGLSVTPIGVLWGLSAAFFYSLYSVFSRFGLGHYKPCTIVIWTFIFSGIGSLFFLNLPNLQVGLQRPEIAITAAGLLVVTVVPYLLYTKGLEQMESGKASILASMEPVTAAFVGILAFGEPVSLAVFLGLGCILLCVFILR